MRFDFRVEEAAFVARPNRFLVIARLPNGEEVRAHCPDPGRLRELLLPGVTVYVSRAQEGGLRRTTHDLRFVRHPETGCLVSLDSRLPNQLIGRALVERDILGLGSPFQFGRGFAARYQVAHEVAAPETVVGAGVHSRFDFCLTHDDGSLTWIEVKSATLVEEGVARFPDAPTARGARHVAELTALVRGGLGRAVILFVVQRADAVRLEPHWVRDPVFAAALVDAEAAGVRLCAFTCTLSTEVIELADAIPVVTRLSPVL